MPAASASPWHLVLGEGLADLRAEHIVVSACMSADGRLIATALAPVLEAAAFSDPALGLTYLTAVHCARRGLRPSGPLLANQLSADPLIQASGGRQFFSWVLYGYRSRLEVLAAADRVSAARERRRRAGLTW